MADRKSDKIAKHAHSYLLKGYWAWNGPKNMSLYNRIVILSYTNKMLFFSFYKKKKKKQKGPKKSDHVV